MYIRTASCNDKRWRVRRRWGAGLPKHPTYASARSVERESTSIHLIGPYAGYTVYMYMRRRGAHLCNCTCTKLRAHDIELCFSFALGFLQGKTGTEMDQSLAQRVRSTCSCRWVRSARLGRP